MHACMCRCSIVHALWHINAFTTPSCFNESAAHWDGCQIKAKSVCVCCACAWAHEQQCAKGLSSTRRSQLFLYRLDRFVFFSFWQRTFVWLLPVFSLSEAESKSGKKKPKNARINAVSCEASQLPNQAFCMIFFGHLKKSIAPLLKLISVNNALMVIWDNCALPSGAEGSRSILNGSRFLLLNELPQFYNDMGSSIKRKLISTAAEVMALMLRCNGKFPCVKRLWWLMPIIELIYESISGE